MLVGLVLVASACTGGGADAGPTRGQVLAALISSGETETVANCVLGLGERSRSLDELDPTTGSDSALEELIDGCRTAERLANIDESQPMTLAFDAEPFTYGDDLRLDALWSMCALGAGRACDVLWADAPVGSEYERFGVTCGEREELLDCSELDGIRREPLDPLDPLDS